MNILFGQPGDIPVTGDWDGDGYDSIGVFRPSTSTWYLRNSNSPNATGVNYTILFGDGPGGDLPVVGDWDNNDDDHRDGIAVFRRSTRRFYLLKHVPTPSAPNGPRVVVIPPNLDYTLEVNYGATSQLDKPVTWWRNYLPAIFSGHIWNEFGEIRDAGPVSTPTGSRYMFSDNTSFPISGKWYTTHSELPGEYRNGIFYLSDLSSVHCPGGDTCPPYKMNIVDQIPFGTSGDIPLGGRWLKPSSSPCMVKPLVPDVTMYRTDRGAASRDPNDVHGALPLYEMGEIVEVYRRSELYENLVAIRRQGEQTLYWIDSGDGRVTYVAGNCDTLSYEPLTSPIINPTTPPLPWTEYPLYTTPEAQFLYQFAMGNRQYNTTADRHPGMDFFTGTLTPPAQGGVEVRAVADGTIVGYFDPNRASTGMDLPGGVLWQEGASPTDRSSGRAYLIVRYGNTYVLYTHLEPGLRIAPEQPPGSPNIHAFGKPVVKGQIIGKTASYAQAHLHFEVRHFGIATFSLTEVPPQFANAWNYFDVIRRTQIDQNLQKRATHDPANAVCGQETCSAGTQYTQCFHSPWGPPLTATPGVGAGIRVYGFDRTPPYSPYYQAFVWRDSNGSYVQVLATLPAHWQTYCKPQ